MIEKYCDILVIGTELTGLLTSALLARRGLSVVVLPTISKSETEASIEPHCFFPLNSLQLKSILGRLGVSEEDLPKKQITSTSLQVILPDHRVDLSMHLPTFEQELDREFPNEKADILHFYQQLDEYRQRIDQEKLEELFLPESLIDRFKLRRLIRDYELNKKVGDFFTSPEERNELLAFFQSQLRYASDAFTSNPFLYQMAKFVNLSDQSYCLLEGGIESLRRLLLVRIAEYGGEVLEPRHIESLDFERHYLANVVINGFEGSIHPRYALWNRSLADLGTYLPQRFRFRRLRRQLAQFTPTHYRFCVQFEIPKTHWPVGMHDQALYVSDPTLPLEGDNCFYIERRLSAQEDHFTLSVHYLLKRDNLSEPESSFKARHDRIHAALSTLMPFTEDVLRLTFPLIDDIGTNPMQETLFPLEKSSFELFLEAAKLHPIYEQTTNSFYDLFPFTYKTPCRNFFLSSPEILMHFGLDGKVIVAKKLAGVLRDHIQVQKAKSVRKKKRAI